jgi:hypothetical protein
MMKSESFPQDTIFFARFFSPKKHFVHLTPDFILFCCGCVKNSPKEKKNTKTHSVPSQPLLQFTHHIKSYSLITMSTTHCVNCVS